MKQVTAKVIKNELISSEPHYSLGRLIAKSQLIWLRNCREIALAANPGQFIMVRCGEECILPRPFSIHQITENGDLALLYSVWETGKGSNWLSGQKKDDNVEIFGPLGNSFSIDKTSRKILLIAGGIGIAPLYFLAHDAMNRGCSVIFLFGTKKAALFHQLHAKNPLPASVKLSAIAEEDNSGSKGRVTDLLNADVISRSDQIFACGPIGMYRDMANKYPQLKNKPVQVSLEVRMGCGVGACYSCTIKTRRGLKQVCKDGPVFDLNDIIWGEMR